MDYLPDGIRRWSAVGIGTESGWLVVEDSKKVLILLLLLLGSVAKEGTYKTETRGWG